MRQLAVFSVFLSLSALYAGGARVREMSYDQAKKVATMVASHDSYKVDDRTVVLNSMDTRSSAGFIPGYYSFSIIQESDTAEQPDTTLRVYIISKRTADTWEMNLCTHYSFPELKKMQQAVMQETGATPHEAEEMPTAIGCGGQVQAQSRPPQ